MASFPRRYSAASRGNGHSSIMESRTTTPKAQGDVSGSVRNLLLSTRRLQDLLREWSVGQATETQVSDAYVQVGTDFNATIVAFEWYQIDLSDIYSVPGDLRGPLEECLVNDPSPEILEQYMPEIRRALSKLYEGLKARKEAWWAAGGRVPSRTARRSQGF